MEPKCSLCGKTVKQLVEEQLSQSTYNLKSVFIELKDKLAYPYLLCGDCEDLLCAIVTSILVEEGIIKWDEAKEKYVLTT